MKLIKTIISDEFVSDFLTEKYKSAFGNLSRIKGGEFSQAFSFEVGGEGKIIRFNSLDNKGFIKDQYCYENFSKFDIPIPKIEEVGKILEFNYAISQKVPGKILLDFSPGENLQLVPEIFEILERLWSIKPKYAGYGYWRIKAQNCQFANSLDWVHSYNTPDHWEEIHTLHPEFDVNLIKKIYAKILNLAKFIPKETYTIHGDFGFTNTLANNGKITGVIDWTESMYCDFLYDLCWLQFNSKEIDYLKLYKNRTTKFSLENYDERCALYLSIIGMESAVILANSNRVGESQECIDILKNFKLI